MPEAAKLPEWLPERWKMEVKRRRDGRCDKYFIDPESKYAFRSKLEVIHYLETGEIRNRAFRYSPGSFKSISSDEASVPLDAREPNNQGPVARHILFETPMPVYKEAQEEPTELSSEPPHLQNSGVGGFDPRTDVKYSIINEVQVEAYKTKENPDLPNGVLKLPQDMELDHIDKKLVESDSVLTHMKVSNAAEHTQQQDSVQLKNSRKDDSTVSSPLKGKPHGKVPVRRSPRNKGANVNISAEGLVQHGPSHVLPLEQSAAKHGMQFEGSSRKMLATLPKVDEEQSHWKDGVSQSVANLQDEHAGTNQSGFGLNKTSELLNKNPVEPGNGNMVMKDGTGDYKLADGHSGISMEMELSAERKGRRDAAERKDTEQEKQSCELLDKNVLAIVNDIPNLNHGINSKTEESDELEANVLAAKPAIDELSKSEKLPVVFAGEITNLVSKAPADKVSKPSNPSHLQRPKKTKTNLASDVPRRSSRRLAGIDVDPALEIVSEWPLKKNNQNVNVPSDSLALKGISLNSEDKAMPVPILSSSMEGENPLECNNPKRHPDPSPVDSKQRIPESSTSFPFGDTWPDPCIEFAFKTLTGDLPILEDTIAIENFFHQHLSPTKSRSPISLPSFTLNFLHPETGVQLDNGSGFNTAAARINQECTLENGLQSTDMNSRLKRAKTN